MPSITRQPTDSRPWALSLANRLRKLPGVLQTHPAAYAAGSPGTRSMAGTAFLAPLAASKVIRRAADAILLRYAHNRTAALDRMDAGQLQHDTLLRLVRHARSTKFGRDHDFARISSVADFQARVPVRDYEWFWNTYWKETYPGLDDVTWPGRSPYYALS